MDRKAVNMRDKKVKLWKKYKVSGAYLVEYKLVCKKVCMEYARSRRVFESRIADEAKVNPKAFYAYVRSKSCAKESVGPLRDGNGKLVTEGKQLCNTLSEFFSSVFTEERLDDLDVVKRTLEEVTINTEVEILKT